MNRNLKPVSKAAASFFMHRLIGIKEKCKPQNDEIYLFCQEHGVDVSDESGDIEPLEVQFAAFCREIANKLDPPLDLLKSKASSEHTLQIITEFSSPDGISVAQIIEQYQKRGIFTHSRLLFDQVNVLIKDKLIYQINPEKQRHRRYASARMLKLGLSPLRTTE